MQCRQCGSENTVENAKFCMNCGTALSTDPAVAPDTAQEPNVASGAGLYQGKLNPNAFSEFYGSPEETPRWRKVLLVTVVLIATAGIAVGSVYHYNRRKYEISELAKLPATASSSQPQSAAAKQDLIFPCPSEKPFCIGTAGSKIKDPACTENKPVWAHYSDDSGATWKRAGCYATEAQARQGLNDKLGLVSPKTHQTAGLPRKSGEAKSTQHTEQPAKPLSNLEEDKEPAKQMHYVAFKGPFGITVEKRTYPSEQMKQKALALWDSEKKILEPDGSINDKYVVKQKSGSGLIPGH